MFAIGNESFRLMGVPGEDLDRVDSATEFVGWYNGHPDFSRLDFDLREVERVAVVGNGNVAMDVARVLVKDPDELAATDIADYALEALQASRVEEVLVLGRRGPAQASFTTKEIREIGSLPGVDLLVSPAQMELDPLSASWLEAEGSPGAKKNVEYLTGKSVEAPDGAPRRLHFEFLVSPIEFLGDAGGLAAVRLERNELYLDDRGTPRPRGTGETRVEQVQLALTAVGYRGVPLAGLPFDDDRGVLPNTAGRIQDDEGQALPGLYAVGWAKRGPTGLIGSNVADAEETVRSMTADLQAGRIRPATAPDPDEPARRLQSRGLRYVSFDDWRRLDDLEVEAGKGRGKIREKFTDVEAMLNALERA
ncbi:MAG: NADP oxidoreductase [Thermoanaerobaculia bacterium]|nr:NADP oxidoreductase [Thermoanaerobaculia bacterium]